MTTEEKQQLINDAKGKMNLANGFRLIFLFVGVVLLLCLYFGPKFFDGEAWFDSAKVIIFRIAEWDIIFLVIATFIKTYFTVKYNSVVKKIM